MALLKASELRSLSIDELNDRAESLRKELFDLRFQAKLAKIDNTGKLKQVRRDIAKMMTVRREMELKKND
jgi:large subunit ribosomal protein L29